MQTVKIGILDTEKEYVENLAAYLNRFGKGQWRVAAFTDGEVLYSYLGEKKLDILVGTRWEELKQIKEKYTEISLLWLSDQEGRKTGHMDIYAVYRFQSAKIVGKTIQNMMDQIYSSAHMEVPMVVIYSPIGRCGKTTFALEIVRNSAYGKWLYIGMEDYSSFKIRKDGINRENPVEADDFIYYLKERQKEKLLAFMQKSEGIIATGRSTFDVRQLDQIDIAWLREVLNQSGFSGAICDMGTGMLKDYEIFLLFDSIIVPYLPEEKSTTKKENFEDMLDWHGLEEVTNKISFINMENTQEIVEKANEIFGRRGK